MKKLIGLIIMIGLISTGCSTNALLDYSKAVDTTQAIETGKIHMELSLDMDFITEGLTFEEIRDLSYFDHIEYTSDDIYDMRDGKDKVIIKSYYNFGGMGLDNYVYINGDDMYMTMPILDGYIDLSEQMEANKETFSDTKMSEDIFEPLLKKWQEVLKIEDVFKGDKTYLLTDEGQIKTTIYTINADEEQLKTISNELLNMLKEEKFFEKVSLKDLNIENADLEDIDLEEEVGKFIERVVLKSFSDTAYVDFDGRLIKEYVQAEIGINDAITGEPESIVINFEMNYSNLGEDLVLEFPTVSDDQWIDIEEGFDYEDIFPVQ